MARLRLESRAAGCNSRGVFLLAAADAAAPAAPAAASGLPADCALCACMVFALASMALILASWWVPFANLILNSLCIPNREGQEVAFIVRDVDDFLQDPT
eukprot:5913391-Amphidinium_carterae.2